LRIIKSRCNRNSTERSEFFSERFFYDSFYIMNRPLRFVLIFSATICASVSYSQSGGSGILNTVNTALPFLRIPPDARSGAMGDVGIAISPDANSMFFNPAKIPFNKKPCSVSVSYVPWIRELSKDIYLAHAGGYFKLDDKQALSASVRRFYMGEKVLTNSSGVQILKFKLREIAIDGGYSRKLSENLGIGISLRFISTNVPTMYILNTKKVIHSYAAAGDVAVFYRKEVTVCRKNLLIAWGLSMSNIGSKISYTDTAQKEFLPANLGIGGAFTTNFSDPHQISIALDLNKLLVPTPDSSGGHLDKSVLSAIISSFYDAPGGAAEEFHEINYSVGAEYWYDQQFAFRAGYFYEHGTKGARQFVTVGLGLKYHSLDMGFSYLVPTGAQRHPLDNTLRFTVMFEFDSHLEHAPEWYEKAD